MNDIQISDSRRRIRMKEIRIRGRGGQGFVTAAETLFVAVFKDRKSI